MQSVKRSSPLLIRADASVDIGTGHVMRCLALAQAWQDRGHPVCFISATLPPSLGERLWREGFSCREIEVEPGSPEDALAVVAYASELSAEWIVADGYHFGACFQDVIRNAGFRLLLVDDNAHASRYSANIVLNQNIYAMDSMYPNLSPETRLLTGTGYCLLRREFLSLRDIARRQPDIARNILVTMGGSDAPNATSKVIGALRGLREDFHARVIVGPANPHLAKLRLLVQGMEAKVELVTEPPDMPRIMLWADIAISAAGTTMWEVLFLRLPAIVTFIAENQVPIAMGLRSAHAAISLGDGLKVDARQITSAVESLMYSPDKRLHLQTRSREIVDGCGIARVSRAMEKKSA